MGFQLREERPAGIELLDLSGFPIDYLVRLAFDLLDRTRKMCAQEVLAGLLVQRGSD